MAAKEALKRAWITAHQIWSQTEAPSSPFHNRRRLKWLVLAGLSMLVFIIVLPVFPLDIGMPTLDIGSVRTAPEVVGWHKPENLTIVALVFYGRRANVQLLERYLRVYLRFFFGFVLGVLRLDLRANGRPIWWIMEDCWIGYIGFPRLGKNQMQSTWKQYYRVIRYAILPGILA